VRVVAVAAPADDLGDFLRPLAGAGVETFRLPIKSPGYLRERRAVRRHLKAAPPDVLHTHGYRSDVLNGGTGRRLGIPTVSTVHGTSRMGGLSHFFEWVQRRVLRYFDAVVAVSAPLREQLRRDGVPADRLHLVPNAWAPVCDPLTASEARSVMGVPPTGVHVGWVGRLVGIKGPDVFIRALSSLTHLDWSASLIGDGPAMDEVSTLIRESGLSDRVRLQGNVPDADRLFPAFDLFVLSSRSEGTPIVLFEAMANDVPIVATAVGGVPDVLGPDGGWLVPSNDPASLAGAIAEALGGAGERRARAARARARLEEAYGRERWLDRLEVVYDAARVVARRRSAGGQRRSA
jgi:L-malate glycosyltransferase